MALDVVDDQMHAPWVALQLPIHRQVASIEQACLLASTAELVLRLCQEVGSLTLPAIGLVPLAPWLLIALTVIGPLSLCRRWRAMKAEGLRLACHVKTSLDESAERR